MVLTVLQLAKRTGRKPETIHRWIREGRLRARKVGTQHVIDEHDLEDADPSPRQVEIPEEWHHDANGNPQADWETLIRSQRDAQ